VDLIPPCVGTDPRSRLDEEPPVSLGGTFGTLVPEIKSAGTLDELSIPKVGVVVEIGAASISDDCDLTLLSGNGGSSGIEFEIEVDVESKFVLADGENVLGGKLELFGASAEIRRDEGGTALFMLGELLGSTLVPPGNGGMVGDGNADVELVVPNAGAGELLKASKPLAVPVEVDELPGAKGVSGLPTPETSGRVSKPIKSCSSGFNEVSVPFNAM